MKIPEYLITIDPEYAKEGEDLGISQIAFVKNPAIKVKGMAFTSSSRQWYTDTPKMRIIAPALIPMSIYRNDDMGEYFVRFTEEEIVDIYKKFMSNLNNRGKFNYEHDENHEVPAYILESWLVEDPELDKSKLYGIDVPKGTLMMVAQITDSKYYQDLIKNDRVGFSIEGFLGLRFSEMPNKIKSKQSMKKTSKRKIFHAFAFADGVFTPKGSISVIAEELVSGAPALVIDETGTPVTDYTGDILIGDALVGIENGVIMEVVTGEAELGLDVMPNAEAGANPESDKKQMGEMLPDEEEAYGDAVVEEEKDGQKEAEVAMAIDQTELLTILQPKFDEIYTMIADLKVIIEGLRTHETTEDREIEEAPISVAQKLSAALNFLSK